MEENKRLLGLFLIIIVIIGIILIINFWPERNENFVNGSVVDNEYKNIALLDYESLNSALKNNDTYIIEVSDSITQKEKETLNNSVEETGNVGYYINLKDIENANQVKSLLKYKKENSFEKDVLLVIKDGEITNYMEEELSDSNKVLDMFDKAGLYFFKCDVKASEEYSNLGEASLSQIKCLYNQKTPFVLVFSQTTCSHCIEYKPELNDYLLKNNLPAYYIEVDKMTEDEFNELTGMFSYFKENESWGTPLTFAISNKKVVNSQEGSVSENDAFDQIFNSIGLK